MAIKQGAVWSAHEGVLECASGHEADRDILTVAFDRHSTPGGEVFEICDYDHQRLKSILKRNAFDPHEPPPLLLLDENVEPVSKGMAERLVWYGIDVGESDPGGYMSDGRRHLKRLAHAAITKEIDYNESAMAVALPLEGPEGDDVPEDASCHTLMATSSLVSASASHGLVVSRAVPMSVLSDEQHSDPNDGSATISSSHTSSTEEAGSSDEPSDELRDEVQDLQRSSADSGSDSADTELVHSTDEEDYDNQGSGAARTSSDKDSVKKDIDFWMAKVPSVFHYFPRDVVLTKMDLLDGLAKHVGATVPPEAEDVVLSFPDADAVAKHFRKLAVDDSYVQILDDYRAQLEVIGSLSEVRQMLKKRRSGSDSEAACRMQAATLTAHLAVARQSWDGWEAHKPSKQSRRDKWKPCSRHHVLNAENGDSAKPGTNPEYSALVVNNALARKEAQVPQNAEALCTKFPLHESQILANRHLVERALKEVVKLEDVASIASRGVDMGGKEVMMAALSFPLGMQDNPRAADYESAQGRSISTASLLFRSLFGDAQSSFASGLLNGCQFRGSEWTTGTVICKGSFDGAVCAHTAVANKRATMDALLAEFDERLQRQGPEALGFGPGEAGLALAARYRTGFSRWMRPHGDVEDWLVRGMDFMDGIACIIPRSSQTLGGSSSPTKADVGPHPGPQPGDLELLGRSTESSTIDPKKIKHRPCDFQQCVSASDPTKCPFKVARAPATKTGSIHFVRASMTLHGARGADWRDVSIYYKNGRTVKLLKLIDQHLPALSGLAKLGEASRALALSILKIYVLAHVNLELPKLRRLGHWKPSSSKHDGEKFYRFADAVWDSELLASAAKGDPELKAFHDELLGEVERVRPDGEASMMAACLEKMILKVAPQTILRPFALNMIERSASSERPLSRKDFPFISDYVWRKRIGHAQTHLDSKVSRWVSFFKKLKKVGCQPREMLTRTLIYGHALYPVSSYYRNKLSEDGEGPLNNVWLLGSVEKARALVSRVATENALARSFDKWCSSIATKRHGISGLPFVTKPANPVTLKGGSGPSLAGYADLSRPELSLLQRISELGASLHSKGAEGAAALLKRLSKKDFPGGGGLTTQRVLTYSEFTLLFKGVLKAYLPGGNGSKKALTFVAAFLGLQPKSFKVHEVLEKLKARMELQDNNSDRRLGAELRRVAEGCEALKPMADACATVGNGLLTGGILETL